MLITLRLVWLLICILFIIFYQLWWWSNDFWISYILKKYILTWNSSRGGICFKPSVMGFRGRWIRSAKSKSNLWFEVISMSMVWQIQYCCTLWIKTELLWSLYICKIFLCRYYYSCSLCWWYCCYWRWSSIYYSVESLFEFSFSYERSCSLEIFYRDWDCSLSKRSIFCPKENTLLICWQKLIH